MKVVYTNQVRDFLKKYERSLRNYGISKERRKEKVKNFRLFLQNQKATINSLSPCRMKKLGQKYDLSGNLILTNLKEVLYKDESQFQWRISLYQKSNNTIKIYRILSSKATNESIYMISNPLLYRISKIVKNSINEAFELYK